MIFKSLGPHIIQDNCLLVSMTWQGMDPPALNLFQSRALPTLQVANAEGFDALISARFTVFQGGTRRCLQLRATAAAAAGHAGAPSVWLLFICL